MAELNGGRVAAVLTADTAVERRVHFLAELDSHLHQLAYAVLVELCERIALEDLLIVVAAEEFAGVSLQPMYADILRSILEN